MHTNSVNSFLTSKNALEEFKASLSESLNLIYKNDDGDIPKQMYTIVYKEGGDFFENQIIKDLPNFTAALLSLHPDLMGTLILTSEIPAEPDGYTCLYDHLCYQFIHLLIENAIQQGIEADVFISDENGINLTPNFKLTHTS